MGGLILSCVDLLVTGLTVVMRVCVVAEEQEKLKASLCKSVMLQMLVSLVYIVDALALLFILHSYNIMTSKTGQYCIKQTGILQSEGTWFISLMVMIGCKLVAFWVWREPEVLQ